MKTLKEIAEELADFLVIGSERGLVSCEAAEREIMKACLDFSRSIVPPQMDKEAAFGSHNFNSCRSQILSSISEAEKELNQ